MEWQAFTQRYFLERPTLVAVLLLVDASIPPQPADLDAADWLGTAEVTGLGREAASPTSSNTICTGRWPS